jgi:hypothetical protein
VAGARQFADGGVGDVLGQVLHGVGVEDGRTGSAGRSEQDRQR